MSRKICTRYYHVWSLVVVFRIYVTHLSIFTGIHLFTKQMDVLPHDPVKSQNREIGCYDDRIVLKFDRHIGSDWKRLNPNLVASGHHNILRYYVRPLIR